MEAKTLFWIILIVAIILLAFREKIMVKLSLDISRSTYFRIVVITGVTGIMIVAYNDYQTKAAIYGWNDNSNNDYSRVYRAYSLAKEEVSRNLKAPSTASFAEMTDKDAKYKINSDGSILIQSYVDAENSFGARIRTYFRCTVKTNDEVVELTTW